MITKTRLFPLVLIPFIAGCAPGPPLPPLFPGFEWLIIALAIWLAAFLWKKHISTEPLQSHYITEMLNAIHQQLNALEKRIELLEKRHKKNEE